MKNYDELIQTCSECISACKSATNKLWMKEGALSQEERSCAQMWNDCATICEACIHFAGRNSPNTDQMMKVCNSICEVCAKECSKHGTPECTKVAMACKKCCEVCGKSGPECRRCA